MSRELWDQVQARLATGKAGDRAATTSGDASLLTGLLYDDTGDRLTPVHASTKGRRYRYYVSSRLIEKRSDDPTGWRLPALEVEGVVLTALAAWLRNPQELMAVIGNHILAAQHLNQSLKESRQLADSIQYSTSPERRALIAMLVSRIIIASGTLVLQIRRSRLLQAMGVADGQAPSTDPTNEEHGIIVPFSLRRRGVEARLVVGDGHHHNLVDPVLVSTIARAHAWFARLASGKAVSINDIAQEQGIPASEISRLLPLAFLAPDIVEAIMAGRQPPELTARHLKRFDNLPLDWDYQRKALGFPVVAGR